jgi:hypothetical protein
MLRGSARVLVMLVVCAVATRWIRSRCTWRSRRWRRRAWCCSDRRPDGRSALVPALVWSRLALAHRPLEPSGRCDRVAAGVAIRWL